MSDVALRIGELAKRAGVAASALRYYEAEGLLGASARSKAGYRLYEPEAVGRVEFIQRAKSLGLPLSQIRRLIESPHADADAEREALRHLVAHKLADTRRRVVELERLSSELEALHVRLQRAPGPDCGHVGDCACWLPTEEEMNIMAKEVACCGKLCCPECACLEGEPCDCPECPCCQS